MNHWVIAGLLVWLGVVEAVTNSSTTGNFTTIRATSRRTRTVTNTRLPDPSTANSSQPVITPAPWLNGTQSLSGSDLATYHNFTYKTLCTYADMGCYNTCMTAVKACTSEHDIWSTGRESHQSSWATLYNDGTMPKSYTTYTVNASSSTIYNFSTSWDAYLQVTTVPAWGAGSKGITQTTVVEDGTTTTKDVYKSGNIVITYTSSVPYAVGETGTPVSTRTRSQEVKSYEVTSWYPFSIPEPSCGPSSWTVCSWSKDCNKCTISGGTVQLLYFPVSATRPGTPPTATTSMPPLITSGPSTDIETAMYGNYTLTSPSIYISFHTAYAQDDCGNQVGKRYPGAILPMKPGELSSVYGGYGTMWSSDPAIPNFSTPYLIAGSFQLADLNWPYPVTAYTNQLKYALGREIFSIVTAPYNPVLAVPPEIRNLDPAWASCALDWEGLYDPPVALTKTDVIAGPTTPAAPVQGAPTSTYPSNQRPEALEPTAVKTPTAPGEPVALQPTAYINQPTQPVGNQPTQPVGDGNNAVTPDPEIKPNNPPSAAIQGPNPDSNAPSYADTGSPSGSNTPETNDSTPNNHAVSNSQEQGHGVPFKGGDSDQQSSSGNQHQEGDPGVSKIPGRPVPSSGEGGGDSVRETISAISNGVVVVDVHRTTTVVLQGGRNGEATVQLGSTTLTVSRVPSSGGGVDVVDGTTISVGGDAVTVGGGGGRTEGSTTTTAPIAAATGGADGGRQFSLWTVVVCVGVSVFIA